MSPCMSNVITEQSVVILHITMKLEDGSVADSSKVGDRPAKILMGDQSLSPAFEQNLLGLTAGDEKSFELAPEDAFGQINPDNIHHMDRSRFSLDAPAEAGQIIAFSQPGGGEVPGIIREVQGDSVTVDFNHPLAGHTITFEVEIVEIQEPAA